MESAILTLRGNEYLARPGQTVGQALRELGFPPEAHLAVREGELLTEDERLRPGDRIRLVPVISGGSQPA